MFAPRYFAQRYYGPRYFPPRTIVVILEVTKKGGLYWLAKARRDRELAALEREKQVEEVLEEEDELIVLAAIALIDEVLRHG